MYIPRLVIATHNAGKLAEFSLLLAEFAGEMISQQELGIAAVTETEDTFEGNALLKARHAAEWAGCAALADDSGLEVDALNGAPGVYSARAGTTSALAQGGRCGTALTTNLAASGLPTGSPRISGGLDTGMMPTSENR